MKNIFIILILSFGFFQYGLTQETPQLETVIQRGHLKYITCSAFSPNGNFVATGSLDNTIKLWDTSSGKEIRNFNRHTEKILSVAFSPDGNYLLSASADNTTIIYNVKNGKTEHILVNTENDLDKAIFSPEGSKVLTQDNRNQTFLWDAKTGKLLGKYKKGYTGGIIHPGWFSPDGNQLISRENYKEVKVKNLSPETDSLTIPFDKAYSAAFSKNGKYIALGSEKLFAELFDTKTGKLLHHLKPDEDVRCDGCKTRIAFSNNSKYIVTASNQEDISLWQTSTGKLIRRIKNTKDYYYYPIFSPNDQYFLVTDMDQVFVYDVKTGNEIFKIRSKYLDYYEAMFSPNSKYILIPGDYNNCDMWDVTTGRKAKVFEGYLNKKRTDGLSYSYTNWTHKHILKYLSMKNTIAVSPDGKYIVKGKIDSVAILISIETGRVEKTFHGHSKVVHTFDFSSDGKLLLTAGGDGLIKIWDVKSAEEVKSIRAHRDLIFDAKFNSDGTQIVSGSWDGSIQIWNVETGEQLQYIKLEKNSPYTIDFTPNDLYVVSGDFEKSVRYWEVDAGEEFRNMVGHTKVVSSFDFSPDGKHLVSASWDGKVKEWDVLTGMLVRKYSHHAGVNAVCYDPKNRFIASGSSDRTIHIWNQKTGKEIQRLNGHMNAVSDIKITADGKKLISSSVDGVIKVWDLTSYQEIYTYIQIGRQDWLAKVPQGHFDGSEKALRYINYVSGMNAVPVGSLFKKYHTPGLLKRIENGETFGQARNIHQMIQSSPEIEIHLTDNEQKIIHLPVDSTLEITSNSIKVRIDIKSNGVALEEIRVYNNGKLVLYEPVPSTTKKNTQYFDLILNNGRNDISAIVLNKNLTESEPSFINLLHYGEDALSDLYILSIGINQYKNPNYELNYALNDAKAYTKIVKKGANSLFNNVVEYFISDEKANKDNILDAINEIAEKAGAEDVFLFYYAGHGVMGKDKNKEEDFYIISYNVTNIYTNPEELKEKAISASELMRFSMKVTAEKQLFVLDACHSGGALNSFAKRGVAREKAISQLARSTGTVFLTASQDVQYANEESKLQHGLFTYAIIEALEGKADSGNKDKKITVSEIKNYVEDRVPELSLQYNVPSQYPTGYSFGQDFPIVIVR